MATADGAWTVARRLELIPDRAMTAVHTTEREAAVRLELREAKLENLVRGGNRKQGRESF